MLGPQVSHPPLFKTPEDDAQSKPHETAEIFTFKLWKKRTNQLDDKSFLFHYFPISIGPKKKIGALSDQPPAACSKATGTWKSPSPAT
jgi:hypothetical protein